MESSEFLGSPGGVLGLALALGVVGGALWFVGDLMLKGMGLDIDEYNRQTSYRRNMRPLDQLTDVYSDYRNFPPMLGAFGFLMVCGAAILAVAGSAWFILRFLGLM